MTIPQGSPFRFKFQGVPIGDGSYKFDVNVATTSGGDGYLLWQDPSGDSVRVVDAGKGLFTVTVPKSLTDVLHRGAYAVNIVQNYNIPGTVGIRQNRLKIDFSVSYDGQSPNPVFEYINTDSVMYSPFDIPPVAALPDPPNW